MQRREVGIRFKTETINQRQKLIILAAWVFAVLFFVSAVLFRTLNKPVTVSYIDVGQGDCCLISAGYGGNVLIDGGDEGSAISIKDFLRNRNIRKLNGVFVSHCHSDHVTGIMDIIRDDFPVEKVYIAKADANDENDKVRQAIEELCGDKNIELVRVKTGDVFRIGKGKYNIIWPGEDEKSLAENNCSLVFKMTYGDSDVLFTGDIENLVTEILAERNGESLEAEVLKVPHHGSQKSADIDFISMCNPDFAVINVGYNNIYGLPSDALLENLAKENIRTLRTDRDGTIEITLGNKGIKNIQHGYKWR